MSKFLISGKFRMGESYRKFSKEIEAKKEESAIKKLKALLGSNHKCKSHLIKIENIQKVE